MQSIEVNSDRRYEVKVGANWRDRLPEILNSHDRTIIFASDLMAKKFELENFTSERVSLHLLPDGEEQKSVTEWQRALDVCGNFGLTRSDAVIAIGGGATTDFTGFVAASWLRGIAWYAIPTTLAAMVDAAIGGKTGLNTQHGKNLVGAFYSPTEVVIDPDFLRTLSDRDFSAGLAEVIKTGFIGEGRILDLLKTCSSLVEVRSIATELISLSAAFKAKVVSSDFKEGRLREILNYGHTLGHAVEKLENYQLRHGEAVAIGLIFAAELSRLVCGLSDESVQMHRELLRRFDLPITYGAAALPQLMEIMKGDKKARGNQMRFIGLEDIGKPSWLEAITSDEITQAYGKISS
jgi:3-dehydroquinate synthase